MPTIDMHTASVPVINQMLGGLSACIDKAIAHCEAKKIDQAALVGFRLYPDMFPFSKQIQIACDMARGGMLRLAGREVPKIEDTEVTLQDLQGRIAATLAVVNGVDPAAVIGGEDREVVLQMRRGPVTFTGIKYLEHFVLPNMFFHVTTAYNILRHNGVELGKADYLGKY